MFLPSTIQYICWCRILIFFRIICSPVLMVWVQSCPYNSLLTQGTLYWWLCIFSCCCQLQESYKCNQTDFNLYCNYHQYTVILLTSLLSLYQIFWFSSCVQYSLLLYSVGRNKVIVNCKGERNNWATFIFFLSLCIFHNLKFDSFSPVLIYSLSFLGSNAVWCQSSMRNVRG